jgi:RNA polymerase sigma-70 factor, ECF subfamily
MIRPMLDTDGFAAASDEALMKAISKHRPSALKELYGRYGKTLKAVITAVVHEQTEADDVLQEILLQIWREAGNYSPHAGRPLGWVVTLARRRAIDRLRRRQAYGRAKDRFEEQIEKQPAGWKHRRVEQEISRADIRRFLERHMSHLPDHQREALELSFFQGMSHREIAACTRTPLGTVKTRLELGLRKLTNGIRPLRHKV